MPLDGNGHVAGGAAGSAGKMALNPAGNRGFCQTLAACHREILGLASVAESAHRAHRFAPYVLFGTVVGKLSEPGLHFLWPLLGWKAVLFNWLGNCVALN
jgi:hypothetical protein